MKGKNIIIFSAIIILVFISASFYTFFIRRNPQSVSVPQTKNLNINKANNMKITSSAFENNANIPQKYTCDGENISPPLNISDVPSETKSLVLIVHDPDAPVAGGFTHWVIFNIDPKIQTIAENSAPENSVQGTIGNGKTGYAGPCPPSGTHHYSFKLYALDAMLQLDSSAKKENLEKAMLGHILDQTELVGLYKRM